MGDWQEIRRRKSELLQETAAGLSEQERNVLVRVLELEIEQRDRERTQAVRERLREFIRQEIR